MMNQTQKQMFRLVPLIFGMVFLLLVAGCGSNPMADFWKAADAFRAKDYETAQRLADKVKAAQPEFVPAYLLLGRIGSARNDEASTNLNYRTAYDLMSRREFKIRTEDIQAQESDLKLSWQEAAFYLADTEFRDMKYNRAEKYYDVIIADSGSGQMKQTAQAYKQATHDFSVYRRNLDLLRNQNIKTPNDARIQADMAALFMDMASGLRRLGKEKSVGEQVALAAKFRDQARQALQALYSSSPDTPPLLQTEALLDYTESQENIMRGKTDVALQKAKDACQKDPNNGKYHFTVSSILAVMAAKQNEPQFQLEERLEYARKAVEKDPKTWRYQTAYAGLLKESGRLREAIDQLVKAKQVVADKEVLKDIDAALADLEKQMSQPSPASGQ